MKFQKREIEPWFKNRVVDKPYKEAFDFISYNSLQDKRIEIKKH